MPTIPTTIRRPANQPAKPNSITVRVRREDSQKLEEYAESFGVDRATAANAALSVGQHLIRGEEIPNLLRTTTAHYLWQCINRDAEDFTAPFELAPDGDGYIAEAERDAAQLGRDMADWCGPLIQIGLEAIANKAAVTSILSQSHLENFFRARAWHTGKGASA